MTFAPGSVVVVGHFETGAAEAALDIEALVLLAAVENSLVAADVGGDVVEGLDEAEAELLALLILGDGNVFNVADFSERMDAAESISTPFPSKIFFLRQIHSTYNFRSTISAPVATTVFSVRAASSMTMM